MSERKTKTINTGTVTLPQFPATLNLNTTGGIPTEYMYQSPGLNISVRYHLFPFLLSPHALHITSCPFFIVTYCPIHSRGS